MTDTRNDEKVAQLISTGGHEAYGLWWMALETIAAGMDKNSDKCSLKYPISKWAAELLLLPQNVCRQLAVIGAVGLLSIRRDGAMLEVSAPNLLKYRDEWSSRKEKTRELLGSKKQIQNTDTEADKEPPTPNAPNGALSNGHKPSRKKTGKRTTEEIQAALGERLPWWENFWKVYPCHDGMNPCMDTFERKVKTHELAVAVFRGAQRYAAKVKAEPDVKVKFGQGWLNDERWNDANVVSGPQTQMERLLAKAREEDARNGIPYESN